MLLSVFKYNAFGNKFIIDLRTKILYTRFQPSITLYRMSHSEVDKAIWLLELKYLKKQLYFCISEILNFLIYVFTFTICFVDLMQCQKLYQVKFKYPCFSTPVECAPSFTLKHFQGLHQIHTTYCRSENMYQKFKISEAQKYNCVFKFVLFSKSQSQIIL